MCHNITDLCTQGLCATLCLHTGAPLCQKMGSCRLCVSTNREKGPWAPSFVWSGSLSLVAALGPAQSTLRVLQLELPLAWAVADGPPADRQQEPLRRRGAGSEGGANSLMEAAREGLCTYGTLLRCFKNGIWK